MSVKCSSLILPTDEEVTEEVKELKALPSPAFFFWEDFSEEEAHPEVDRIRAFRSLVGKRTHGSDVKRVVTEKQRKYQRGMVEDVRCFVLSAGGAIAADAYDLCKFIVSGHSELLREQSFFRRWLWARLSIVLLKYASRMCYRTGKTPSVTV